MTELSPKDTLIEHFQDDSKGSFHFGRTNHLWDIGMTMGAILASLLATALVSADIPKYALAMLTALPAAFSATQSSIAFRRKSHWYFTHATKVRALRLELEVDPHPDLRNYAKLRTQIDLDMESELVMIEDGAAAATKAPAKEAAKKGDDVNTEGDTSSFRLKL